MNGIRVPLQNSNISSVLVAIYWKRNKTLLNNEVAHKP